TDTIAVEWDTGPCDRDQAGRKTDPRRDRRRPHHPRLGAARQGCHPGAGHRARGDDPGSHSYVKMKHRDCEQVGITSIRRDLPADATQAELEAVIDELNADPACTGYIVQLPLPGHLDEN